MSIKKSLKIEHNVVALWLTEQNKLHVKYYQ